MSILINKNTRVICQGFTGKQGTFHSQQAIENGTQLVGGVTPGKGGQFHLERPVFDTVRAAVAAAKAAGTMIYVPAPYTAKTKKETSDTSNATNKSITEGIPVVDMLKVKAALKSYIARLIGPN